MARLRTIKPTFWADEKLSKVSHSARLLYIGLWNISDDYGVIQGDTRYIHGQIFPYEMNLDVGKLLNELAKIRRIFKCEHNGNIYYYIPTFNIHQKINRASTIFRNVPAEVREKFRLEFEAKNSSVIDLIPPEKPPKTPKQEALFTPDDPRFKEVFDMWLEYKKERRESYKDDKSLKQCYEKLVRLSCNDPVVAMEMIKDSMANNYSGFFALKPKYNGSQSPYMDKRRTDGVDHAAQSLSQA